MAHRRYSTKITLDDMPPCSLDLIYVGGDFGTQIYRHTTQPTTDDMACMRWDYRYCIQKVGRLYEVYDLNTLRKFLGRFTIGLPVYSHEDPDVAIMWALLKSGG